MQICKEKQLPDKPRVLIRKTARLLGYENTTFSSPATPAQGTVSFGNWHLKWLKSDKRQKEGWWSCQRQLAKSSFYQAKLLSLLEFPGNDKTAGSQMGILSVLLVYSFPVSPVFLPLISRNAIYLGSLMPVFHYRSQLLKANLAGGLTEQSQLPYDGLFLSHLAQKWAIPLNCTSREAKVWSQSTEGTAWASCNCDKSCANLHCLHGPLTFTHLFSIYCWSQETQRPSENE